MNILVGKNITVAIIKKFIHERIEYFRNYDLIKFRVKEAMGKFQLCQVFTKQSHVFFIGHSKKHLSIKFQSTVKRDLIGVDLSRSLAFY